MTRPEEQDKTFDVLRELPVEVSMEQVGGMIATFTLAPAAGSWFSHINLNSILMTSAGATIIAGTIYFLSPTEPAPRTVQQEIVAPAPAVELAATPPEVVVDPGTTPAVPTIKTIAPTEEEIATITEPAAPAALPKNATTPATPAPVRNGNQTLDLPLAVYTGGPPLVITGREFNLSGFALVSVRGAMDVVLEQGAFSITAEGPLVDRLELTVKDRKLVITTKNKEGQEGCTTGEEAKVHVTMPALEGLELTGSGDVVIGAFTGTGNFDLDLQGSGDIHFAALKGLAMLAIDLDGSGDIVGEGTQVSGRTKINVNGSGDVRIAGRTDALEVKVVGSGDVEASGLEARACEAQVTGSGNVNMNCDTGIQTRITGSGSVNNTGNAGGGGTNGDSHSN